jgi:t-SNARE complex subunit (syntaxin)
MGDKAEILQRHAEDKGSCVAQQEEQLGERETQVALKAASAAAALKVRGCIAAVLLWMCVIVVVVVVMPAA